MDQAVEKSKKQEKEIQRLAKENVIYQTSVEKLQEWEQKAQELISQTSIQSETITTLQQNLITEKLNNEKLKNNLEKLGLNMDVLDNDINVIVEKMLNNPDIMKICSNFFNQKIDDNIQGDVFKQAEEVASSITLEWKEQCDKLCAEINNLQHVNECLQQDNAKLQVDIATFTSQVHSLQSQQTALQLANSQLVAEKEEVNYYIFLFIL